MMKNNSRDEELEKLLEELIKNQKNKMLLVAKKIVPHITPEDLLQPQDYPELDYLPDFRYEEGILCGMETALFAIRAQLSF